MSADTHRLPHVLSAAVVAGSLLITGASRAAIILDAKSSAASPSGTTLTFDHTIGDGSDRLLVVSVAVEADNPDADVSTVTYNGITLTKAIDRVVGTTTDLNVEI